MVHVGVADAGVLGHDVEGADVLAGGVDELRHGLAGLVGKLRLPGLLELLAHGRVGHALVAGVEVGQGPHVAGALHVVLAAQRVDPGEGLPDLAAEHRQIADGDHVGHPAGMLRDAHAVDDGGIVRLRVRLGHLADRRLVDAGLACDLVQGPALEERPEGLDILRPLLDEIFCVEPAVDDVAHHAGQQGDVRARVEPQELAGIAGHRGLPRVDDEHLRPPVEGLVDLTHEDGVALGGVGADEKDAVRAGQVRDGVRHGAAAEGLQHPHRGGRVAEPGAVVHVVGPEGRPDELLKEVVLLVGALGRREPAHAVGAVFFGRLPELAGRQIDGLLPGDLHERVALAQKRGRQPFGVMDELVGKPALHAERAPAHRVFPVGVRGGGAPVLDLQDDAASRAAVGAYGSDEFGVHGFFPVLSTQAGTFCPGRGSWMKSKRTGDLRSASSPAS